MTEFLQELTEACKPILILLFMACVTFIIAWLNKKTAQIKASIDNETANKYIDMAADAVSKSVAFTAQTFVDALKKDDAFTEERQLEAFNMAKEMTLQILGDTAIKALEQIYGDLDTWLGTAIEQECRNIK